MNIDLETRYSIRIAFALISLVVLNGCATNIEPQPLPPNHPASAQGQEAPRTPMKRLVTTDQLTSTSKAQLAREEVPNPDFQSDGMSHDMGNMSGMDMSKPAAGAPPAKTQTMPGMDASQMQNMTPTPGASPANKEAVEMQMKKTSDEMKKTSDELKARSDAAKRPKSEAEESVKASPAATIYTCVMHPEVQLPAPGKCPKCGMTLVKKKPTAP
jgi:hypothetical protein